MYVPGIETWKGESKTKRTTRGLLPSDSADVRSSGDGVVLKGLVVYGWELRVCLTAVVSPGGGCSYAAAESSMDEQARQVKAINPHTLVFHYRNTMQALSPFKDQCLKMRDPSYGGFFLRQSDLPAGPCEIPLSNR